MKYKQLILTDSPGNMVYKGSIWSLKIAEKLIIKKSIEFFNDSEPCFIHRSAVVKRLIGELEEFFEDQLCPNKKWVWEELPHNIKDILSNVSDHVAKIEYI